MSDAGDHRRIELKVRRYRRFGDTAAPPVVGELLKPPGVLALTWKE
jgi:hypothetical protein